MNDMGDKINSKRIAKNAGCFVIPGYEGQFIRFKYLILLFRFYYGDFIGNIIL